MINPVMIIILTLAAGFIAPLVYHFVKRVYFLILSLIFAFNIMEILLIMPDIMNNPIVMNMSGIRFPWGITLVFTFTGTLILLTVNILALLYSIYLIRERGVYDNPQVVATVFPIIIAGVMTIVSSIDIFNIFVFIELVTIGVYILAGSKKLLRTDLSVIKFITGTTIGSLLMLLSIASIYSMTGTLNLIEINSMIIAGKFNLFYFSIAAFIFLFGMLFEMYIFPANIFVTDLYGHSDCLSDSVYSGIIQTGMLFVFIKLFILFTVTGIMSTILIILASLTIIISELSALSSSNIKRMLGFSSFSHSGMIVLLVVISKTEQGTGMMLNAAVVMLIIHALSKFIMFFALRALSDERGRVNAGFAARPFAVFTFTIGALTLSGIPPFPMFYIKFRILAELIRTGHLWIGIIILFATFIEILYLFRVIRKIFISRAEPSKPEHITTILPAAVILIITFYLTLNPSIINRGTVMQDFRSEMRTARDAAGPVQSGTVEGEQYND